MEYFHFNVQNQLSEVSIRMDELGLWLSEYIMDSTIILG